MGQVLPREDQRPGWDVVGYASIYATNGPRRNRTMSPYARVVEEEANLAALLDLKHAAEWAGA
jgi:hypothetical protein